MLFRKFCFTILAATFPVAANAQSEAARPVPALPATQDASSSAAQTGINVSARDMQLVIEGFGFPPQARAKLAASAAERKLFAKDIRQLLATAEAAEAAGYLTRPQIKLGTELARAFVISQAYSKQRDAAAKGPEQLMTETEVEAFFKDTAAMPQFEAFLQHHVNNGNQGTPLNEDQRKELRQKYGRVMVAMRKGLAAGLDHRTTQLVVVLQQARLLASAYAKELSPRFKASDAEIDAYLAKHPELDSKPERARIEGLLARAQAGEDFAKLADEFSDDSSKTDGGDLGWFGRETMVKPFEDASFALKPGELSGVIESQFGYHIIKLEERRTQGEAGEQVHARHILIRFNNAPRDPNSPPMSPREQARVSVEEEKRESVLEEMVARGHVEVAEDYEVSNPETEASKTNRYDGDGMTPDPTAAPSALKPATTKSPQSGKRPAARRATKRRRH